MDATVGISTVPFGMSRGKVLVMTMKVDARTSTLLGASRSIINKPANGQPSGFRQCLGLAKTFTP